MPTTSVGMPTNFPNLRKIQNTIYETLHYFHAEYGNEENGFCGAAVSAAPCRQDACATRFRQVESPSYVFVRLMTSTATSSLSGCSAWACRHSRAIAQS